MTAAPKSKETPAMPCGMPGSRSKMPVRLPEPELPLEVAERRAYAQPRDHLDAPALAIPPRSDGVRESGPVRRKPPLDLAPDLRVAPDECGQRSDARSSTDQLVVTGELNLSQSTRTPIAASRSRVSSSSKCAIWPSR